METTSSNVEEDDYCNSEDEEENTSKTQEDENDAPCVQKQQSSWTPSFFYRMDREMHHFVGQDILIREAQDSFAATTWPAASALCRYLERHHTELNLVDKAVLEIGSGTGLVSIVAALLGAWVTATDLPDALGNLRVNLSKNTRGKSRHTPQVAALSWSFNLESTYPTSVYHYDYVLGADIVYHHDFLKELLATMKHFCQPGTKLLWANKMRMETDLEFVEKFKKTFDTKVVFEEGDMKIFMATHREDGEEEAEDLNAKSTCEREMQVQSEEETEDEEEVEGNDDEDVNAGVLTGPDGEFEKEDDVEKVDAAVERSEEEVTLSDTDKDSEETEDEEEDEEEEEEGEGNDEEDKNKEPTNSPDQGEQKNIKPFNWAPSVISCLGKEVYHYVGTDINIFEAFDTYGGVMWPGAVALCSFLEHNRDMVNLEDKTVMEL
ncbi:hypothetical protein NQD34_002113 [Periophthalmus magnuspinnatus]|nr:hypothetical protein NQD34_002113 [Periophthalmus magnuspinnatus]